MIQLNNRWNDHIEVVVERISDRVFAMEVDGKRLNISVERLKPGYFTAQQEEQAINSHAQCNYRMNPHRKSLIPS